MKKIMLIGYGAIAKTIIEHLPAGIKLGWIVARENHHTEIKQRFSGDVIPISNPLEVEQRPDLVLECASQQAVYDFAESIIQQGWSLALISTGALADDTFYSRLQNFCTYYQGKLHILSGAIAGMDGLSAAREGGLEEVTYLSNKSPNSWQGSPAETLVDLESITEPTVFFTGSAREAAQIFPANANVAATIALMGIGMDLTQVKLQADPITQHNSHTIYARGQFGELSIKLVGNPLKTNPKTSTLAALSVVAACKRLI